MKRRITLMVDEDKRKSEGAGPFLQFGSGYGWTGVTIESDEVIPEPDRVQEFNVRIVTKAEDLPFIASDVCGLIQRTLLRLEKVTVTEVKS